MRQNLSFHLVGVSHHTAAVQERERFAFTKAETESLLESFHQQGKAALLLSTCNRCELYWHGSEDGEAWFLNLARQRGVAASPLRLTRYEGMAAVRHLFMVSGGLDSQILGESEILGQVRRAYDAARAAGTTTREMDLIFSAALSTGRRLRRETLLGRHPASVSSAAVDYVTRRLGATQRRVIILGAGEAAEGVLRALHQQGASQTMLLSRHPDKARVLAGAWGAEVGAWEELDQRLQNADLLMVATGSGRPVVTAAQLSRVAIARGQHQLLVVDLAVPRNVEPTARNVAGIELLDLDDLQQLCCPAAGSRFAGLAEAEGIIEDELVRLSLNLRSRVAAPRLAELHRHSQEVAQQESARALAQLESLSESEREIVRQMADRLVRRVLYPVSQNLRGDT